MYDECAPSLPVSRLIYCSGLGDSFSHVNNAASDNIHEVLSMDSVLICNDTDVYGGGLDLNIFVRDLSERCNSFESEFTMMFLVPLIY